ncbi:bifunctional 3,4-dihydroxy-2-butanone-4-phosphate synthase/GTP cyclohydrolase II [Pseudonocardia sp. NPDC049154]|uniref:bifunctional 3,4-dihydroxy-2-butanone-4-phosphate synthase/GTP cyclohydrolase II n=1 Tax=Pseudonocardia sp. NPDC049154 TaxID=3155501 RepID=UPI0033D4D555
MNAVDRVEAALTELRRGRMVLVVDDEDREDEGDLVMAAEHVTAADAAFLIRHTSGVLCVAMPDGRADELDLPLMVAAGDDPRHTAFTVTVDLKAGTTTGVSAADRAATITALAHHGTRPADLSRPGHVFPLRARAGGVLVRGGHTEATVDLCRLAGLAPVGVLGEVTSDDGTMTRGPALRRFAADHGLVLLSVADVVAYRRAHETVVLRRDSARLPTAHGEFAMTAFSDLVTGAEHLALVRGEVRAGAGVLVRVHSECLTGDVLGSRRCDCGQQLDESLRRIAEEGRGVLVYLRGHEGRGIGLAAKVRAYDLQDGGLDTVDANLAQGLGTDLRDYTAAAEILHALGVRGVRLLTNNPDKARALREHGIDVAARIALRITPNADNLHYLATKSARLGHDLAEPSGARVG